MTTMAILVIYHVDTIEDLGNLIRPLWDEICITYMILNVLNNQLNNILYFIQIHAFLGYYYMFQASRLQDRNELPRHFMG